MIVIINVTPLTEITNTHLQCVHLRNLRTLPSLPVSDVVSPKNSLRSQFPSLWLAFADVTDISSTLISMNTSSESTSIRSAADFCRLLPGDRISHSAIDHCTFCV